MVSHLHTCCVPETAVCSNALLCKSWEPWKNKVQYIDFKQQLRIGDNCRIAPHPWMLKEITGIPSIADDSEKFDSNDVIHQCTVWLFVCKGHVIFIIFSEGSLAQKITCVHFSDLFLAYNAAASSMLKTAALFWLVPRPLCCHKAPVRVQPSISVLQQPQNLTPFCGNATSTHRGTIPPTPSQCDWHLMEKKPRPYHVAPKSENDSTRFK